MLSPLDITLGLVGTLLALKHERQAVIRFLLAPRRISDRLARKIDGLGHRTHHEPSRGPHSFLSTSWKLDVAAY